MQYSVQSVPTPPYPKFFVLRSELNITRNNRLLSVRPVGTYPARHAGKKVSRKELQGITLSPTFPENLLIWGLWDIFSEPSTLSSTGPSSCSRRAGSLCLGLRLHFRSTPCLAYGIGTADSGLTQCTVHSTPYRSSRLFRTEQLPCSCSFTVSTTVSLVALTLSYSSFFTAKSTVHLIASDPFRLSSCRDTGKKKRYQNVPLGGLERGFLVLIFPL